MISGHVQDSPGIERMRNRDGRGGRLGGQHQSDLSSCCCNDCQRLFFRRPNTQTLACRCSPIRGSAFCPPSFPSPLRSRRQASPESPFWSSVNRSADRCKAIYETPRNSGGGRSDVGDHAALATVHLSCFTSGGPAAGTGCPDRTTGRTMGWSAAAA